MKKTEMKKKEMAKKMYRMNGEASGAGGGEKPRQHGKDSGYGRGEKTDLHGKNSGHGKGEKPTQSDTKKKIGAKEVYDMTGPGSTKGGGMGYKQACQ